MSNWGTPGQRIEAWLARAKAKHGDRFGYERTRSLFANQKSKIPVTCTLHGEFWTTGDKHLAFQNGGCIACGRAAKSKAKADAYRLSYGRWLDESLPPHLDVVGEFSAPSEPLRLRCKIHGTIKTTTAVYLKNNQTLGCDACSLERSARSRQLDLADVEHDLAGQLPALIELVGVERTPNGTKVRARCSRHGEFLTTKGSLARAKFGCPECKRENSGYTSNRLARLIESNSDGVPCQIGVMEVEVFGIRAVKVGVTVRTLTDRYKWYLKRIIWSATVPERLAYVLENRIHRRFAKEGDGRIKLAGMRLGKRWEGDTEVYPEDKLPPILDYARSQLAAFARGSVNYPDELASLIDRVDKPMNVSRNRSDANLPKAVEGIDPVTRDVVLSFASLSEAARAGYRNVSLVLNPESPRRTAGGLLWRLKQ